YNEAREVNELRARAIEVSVAIRAVLEPYIAGRIAKWDDTFNPRAFGDLTSKAGVSTILIESGGIEGDLQKQQLRKLNFLALAGALDAIATGSHAGLPHALYTDLPENGRTWADLRISGGTLAIPGQPQARVDVLVEFERKLLERNGRIVDIGDLDDMPARRSIDASGLYIVPTKTFARHEPARFKLSRDPEGRDVVWTLAGDVDPASPAPQERRGCSALARGLVVPADGACRDVDPVPTVDRDHQQGQVDQLGLFEVFARLLVERVWQRLGRGQLGQLLGPVQRDALAFVEQAGLAP